MTDKTNETLKKYYINKVEGIMTLKLPKFVKLKFLEELNFEFMNDLFSGIRLPRESYMDIYNTIQSNKRTLKLEQTKPAKKINFAAILKREGR